MGYDKITQKLTFYKAFFSPQWKFLIHTILQGLSAKTTAWNEFSSTMESAIICLANNQKFNFSKYIFDNMVLDLEKAKTTQAKKIADLKKRVKKQEWKKKARTLEITLADETQGMINEEDMFGVNDSAGDAVIVDATTGKEVEQCTKVSKKEVSTADLVTTTSEVVTTDEDVEVTIAAITLQISKDKLTLA
nr:glutamic acid-rich protein-like [Tanacetum cinerariifolium]